MSSDYYEIFGVAPDADIELIKRRYRVLVRENHPDVSNSEDAHARMQLILEAWNVLSQPASRARYDLSRREPTTPAKTAPVNRSSAARSTPGTGRPHSNGAPARSRTSAPRPKVDVNPRAANPRTRLLTMVFEAAQLYHRDGSTADAMTLCNRVLKSDPRNSEAAALLGDIYAGQGRDDMALLMYRRATMNQPKNLLFRQKWEALQRKMSNGASHPSPVAPSQAASSQAASSHVASSHVAPSPRTQPYTAPVHNSSPPAAPRSAPEIPPVARAAGCSTAMLLCCGILGLTWLLQIAL